VQASYPGSRIGEIRARNVAKRSAMIVLRLHPARRARRHAAAGHAT